MFKEVSSGLHVYNADCNNTNTTSYSSHSFFQHYRIYRTDDYEICAKTLKNDNLDKEHTLMQTVENNETQFSLEEVRRARQARLLSNRIGIPTVRKLSKWLNKGLIKKCHITSKDLIRAEFINDSNVMSLRLRSTRRKKLVNAAPNIIRIPKRITDKYYEVRLFFDVMYVNKLPFLHTMSEKLIFSTSSSLISETKDSLCTVLCEIVRLRRRRGFKVKYIDAYRQFECTVIILTA